MFLNAIAEKLNRRSEDDFKGRQFEAWLIIQVVSWQLRYPLSGSVVKNLLRLKW